MPRAGLTPASVTEAGAAVADEIGFTHLSMGLVAARLGVRTPSLYKHVGSQADLAHRIAVLGANQFGDAVRDATQGRAGGDALAAAAQALRIFVAQYPGRYEAANTVPASGPDDPIIAARARGIDSLRAVLHGYRLGPQEQIHALRMLRSMLHGFVTLELGGGFQFAASVEDSFTWMVEFVDQGLRTMAGPLGALR